MLNQYDTDDYLSKFTVGILHFNPQALIPNDYAK